MMGPVASRRLWGAAVLLIAVLPLVVACASESGAVGPAAARQNDDEPFAAPDFTLDTITGDTYSLAESAGQVRLVDFWATWCAPCREEIPMLNELQAAYGDRGFQVVAISDEEAGVLRDFVARHEMTYTSLVGTAEVIEAYHVLGLPSAYLVDANGRIVDKFLGPKPRKVLVEKIEALLEAAPST